MQLIVVLGNRDTEIMKKRFKRALNYFRTSPRELKDGTILKTMMFSGGKSDNIPQLHGLSNYDKNFGNLDVVNTTDKEEAIWMYDYAVAKGVRKRFLKTETVSKNTYENILFLREKLEEDYEFYRGHPKITICTSSFHLKRVMVICKFLLAGFDVNYIHTNEQVSASEIEKENRLLIANVDQLTNREMVRR